jgi:hypothetical protein
MCRDKAVARIIASRCLTPIAASLGDSRSGSYRILMIARALGSLFEHGLSRRIRQHGTSRRGLDVARTWTAEADDLAGGDGS